MKRIRLSWTHYYMMCWMCFIVAVWWLLYNDLTGEMENGKATFSCNSLAVLLAMSQKTLCHEPTAVLVCSVKCFIVVVWWLLYDDHWWDGEWKDNFFLQLTGWTWCSWRCHKEKPSLLNSFLGCVSCGPWWDDNLLFQVHAFASLHTISVNVQK